MLIRRKIPSTQAELHFVRLGDLAVATNPFELYTDYGLRIKARSPATQTVVVQLTSDCAAYLPTERAVTAGGYSARIVDGIVGVPPTKSWGESEPTGVGAELVFPIDGTVSGAKGVPLPGTAAVWAKSPTQNRFPPAVQRGSSPRAALAEPPLAA